MTNSKKFFAFLSLLFVMLFSFSDPSNAHPPTGYVPFPVDLSYLKDNPPVEVNSNTVRSAALPSTYDLRSLGRIPTRIVNQGEYGICWACAAIAAMESNYMTQGKADPDLSEMHLAYFAKVNTNRYKAFLNFSSDSPLIDILQGLNFPGAAAIYSRLDGPVSESDVPFNSSNPQRPQYSVPEAYRRVLRLREAYFLAQDDSKDSRDNIKKRIMENGAVCISYYSDQDNYNKINGHTTYYSTSTGFNHGVVLVGWDDNFSRDNFSPKPNNNGAWLVRNSYGQTWQNKYRQQVGDNGYFWMSYDTSTGNDSTAFIVEEADSDMKCYYYDALG